jgi:hypothetical protein
MFQDRYKDIKTTLTNKARNAQIDFDDLRCLRALKYSSWKQELKVEIQKITKGGKDPWTSINIY